jgi:hypothetical protein
VLSFAGDRRHNTSDSMKLFRTVLVLGFFASLAMIPARPPAPAPVGTLTASILKKSPRLLYVRFDGTAPLPGGSILSYRVFRHEETDQRGTLARSLVSEGTGTLVPAGGTFSFDQLFRVPGLYRVELELRDRPKSVFEFRLWDDDLLPRALAEMGDIEKLTLSLVGLCVRMNVASTSARDWHLKPMTFFMEMQQAQTALDAGFAPLFPATRGNLRRALGLLKTAPHHFFWKPDGSFGGAYDGQAGKWIEEPYGAPFSFERMVNFIEDTYQLGRRELALWGVEEARRSGRRSAPPQIALLLQGLETGQDLEQIEARIRSRAVAAKPTPEPPEPPFFVLRKERVEEASTLLRAADRRWDELGDRTAPALYRRLLQDYPVEMERLGARVRVAHRARSE